jgi:hypothetical protein
MKELILGRLHKLIEDKTIPQDYSKEFGQTGSGKAIHGKQNVTMATTSELSIANARMVQANLINKAYKQAYDKGLDAFNVEWQGKLWKCEIPQQFRRNTDLTGKRVDYRYYFDYPDLGDGGFQASMNRAGYIQIKNIKSKPDMNQNPNMSQATDAGYEREYEGREKYFNVKAGVLGKEGNGRYSIFPTPALDASLKVNIGFRTEILDFMEGGRSYTADNKGKELSNAADFEMKIKKIKKDAEGQINRQLTGNDEWETWKAQVLKTLDTPEKQNNADTQTLTQSFMRYFKSKNPQMNIGKPEISMSSDELADFEKRQAMIQARIAAARKRK